MAKRHETITATVTTSEKKAGEDTKDDTDGLPLGFGVRHFNGNAEMQSTGRSKHRKTDSRSHNA